VSQLIPELSWRDHTRPKGFLALTSRVHVVQPYSTFRTDAPAEDASSDGAHVSADKSDGRSRS